MRRASYRIGVISSTAGSYSVIGRSMLNGALLALREAESHAAVALDPVIVNPEGDLARYAEMCQQMLASGIRHVVGCYTSSSRKEVIPYFEKHDALLWYPSHYEGFESSNNVIYTGASPNQHVLPLVDYLLANLGTRAFCVGSNYIWAWENNRIFREAMTAAGGGVLAERYLPVGDCDVDPVIEAILAARPDFVFSNFIGTSAYAFFRRFRAICRERGIDQPRQIPVTGCTISEPELEEIGPTAVDGHVISSVYFSSLESPANRTFTEAYRDAFPDGPTTSADAESSYVAVKLLAAALAAAGTDEVDAVKKAATATRFQAPQGSVWLDPETLHTYLTPRIGRSNAQARFDVLVDAGAPVKPDPYLVQSSPRFAMPTRAPNLRVIR